MTEELRLVGLARERIDAVSGLLFGAGSSGIQESWLPGEAPAPRQPWDEGPPAPEPARVVLSAWFDDADHAAVGERLEGRIGDAAVEWHPVAEVDWEAEWRKGFVPVRVSDRLIVAPPWDAPEGALVIEPGQGFGTGHHPTTLQALRALERLLTDDPGLRTALDVGCGSGILALAAAKRGLTVRGVDVEASAVRDAEANAARNGLTGHFSTTPVRQLREPADVVLANLHAELVAALAPHLARLTGRWLVVAGILADREATATAALPLPLHARETDGEWVCLVYRRDA